MPSKRNKKRKHSYRSKKPQPTTLYRPGGKFVLAAWAVTLVLIGGTYLGYRAQMIRQGYAHLSVAWLVILFLLVLMAIGVMVQWYGSKTSKTEKDNRR